MISTDKKRIIAIDGYSSCGKSTFAKAIAKELDYLYIDSGAMYRSVAHYALKNGYIKNGIIDKEKIKTFLKSISIDFVQNEKTMKYETFLNGENVEKKIRSIKVSDVVSDISKLLEVREKMVALQRSVAEKNKGVVMDGRDIGTTVFPNADLKIFMTANNKVRAMRRYNELKEKGIKVNFDEVKRNIEERDFLDSSREISPLKKADDAVELDNSNMTPHQQMIWFRDIFKKKNLY